MTPGVPIPVLVAQGFVAGWSVAWPPGPINAEMIRRGIATGRFGSAASVGVGACSGDFLWALGVTSGLGFLAHVAWFRWVMAAVSGTLLLALAWLFLSGAARAWRTHREKTKTPGTAHDRSAPRPFKLLSAGGIRGGFLLGLAMALTSPWNVAFWVGVIGQRAVEQLGTIGSLVYAGAVVGGALTWVLVLCIALRFGARFATPAWDIGTRAATGLLMLYFAGRLVVRMTAA